MSESYSVAIPLPQPLLGSVLMRVVWEAIARQNSARPPKDRVWFSYKTSYEGDQVMYQVGQSSHNASKDLLVAPSASLIIRPDEIYPNVIVMRHCWWKTVVTSTSCSDEEISRAMAEFMGALLACLEEASHDETPSVWPQEVTVCVLCEQLTTARDIDGHVHCPTHGKNPPTRQMRIMPESS